LIADNCGVPPKVEVVAIASFGDDPKKIRVILPVGQPETMLAEVSTKPNFQLFGMAVSYSYPQEELAKLPAQPANTLVEITVPYCFHVPDGARFEVKDTSGTVYLAFKKVWTELAKGSSEADYRSPTHVLYHNKITVQTPFFPHQLSLGPHPIFEGINVEAHKDQSGIYRYSLVRMFFDTGYSAETLISKSSSESARAESIARAVEVINRFVDVYRVVTKSAHVQRLPALHVRDIYFRGHKVGFHGASFGHGIRTAIMNRSEAELEAIAKIVATGEEIMLWDLLFLDAEASLGNNQFTLAVVNAFQALELRLQQFIEARMELRGLSSTDIEDQLKNKRTKERLKDLVPDLVGRKLISDDKGLWDRFCWAYDIRNKLIHSARDLDYAKTETTVTACHDVSRWLGSIP
jgi:hypothetical protein